MKEVCDYWVDEREERMKESVVAQAFEDLDEAMSKLIDVIDGLDECGIDYGEVDKAHIILSNFRDKFDERDDEPDYYHDKLQRRLDGEEF